LIGRGLIDFGVRAVVRGQRLGDLGEPFVEQRGRARIERGHGANDARPALRNHELRVADDEQRRGDHRQRKALQRARQAGHG
jgi:hypothetical protein